MDAVITSEEIVNSITQAESICRKNFGRVPFLGVAVNDSAMDAILSDMDIMSLTYFDDRQELFMLGYHVVLRSQQASRLVVFMR